MYGIKLLGSLVIYNFICVALVVQKPNIDSIQGYFTSFNASLLDWPTPFATIDIPLNEFKEYESNGSLIVISSALRNVSVFFSNASDDTTK